MAEQSLKDKTVKGTFWSAVDAFMSQGVTFIVGIVLARLLSPDDFGLIGICLIFKTVLAGIVDSGFSNALIRKKDVDDEEYHTMFWVNMVVSIFLYFLLYLSSPFISSFFERNELTSLIRVSGILLFLNALTLTHNTIISKRIAFKIRTKASLISAISSGVIGIGSAYWGLGVWSLIIQLLSRQFLYTLTLWILVKWWPRFIFSTKSFKYMWGFGWKILVSGLLNNIWNQLYQVVVGKFYSPATLGQYTRGSLFVVVISENITTIIQRVSFPALSELQDNKTKLREAYREIIKITMHITVILTFTIAVVAKPLVIFTIGEKWLEAAGYIPFICLSMSLYPLHAINLNMLQIQGRSDIFLYIEIAKKFVSIIPLAIGIFYSIYGMLIASVFSGIVNFFLNSSYSGKAIGYSTWNQIKDILPEYLISAIIVIPAFVISLIPLPTIILLSLQIGIIVSIYFALNVLLKRDVYCDIVNIIKNRIRK